MKYLIGLALLATLLAAGHIDKTIHETTNYTQE